MTHKDCLELAAAYMQAAQSLRHLHELKNKLGYVSNGEAAQRIEELEWASVECFEAARKKWRSEIAAAEVHVDA